MSPIRNPHRKKLILIAAARLIAHYGFEKTTMDDIAHEAGVSKGALYLEFPGKSELFDSLIQFEMKNLLVDFQNRIETDPQGGKIANIYSHALMALKDNPLMTALYTQDSRVLGNYINQQDPHRYIDRILFSEQAICQMQNAGLLRQDIRPQIITYIFTIISLGFLHVGTLIQPDQQPALDEIIPVITNMVMCGFAGPGDDNQIGKTAFSELSKMMLSQYEDKSL